MSSDVETIFGDLSDLSDEESVISDLSGPDLDEEWEDLEDDDISLLEELDSIVVRKRQMGRGEEEDVPGKKPRI
jgi:hypothetical protein